MSLFRRLGRLAGRGAGAVTSQGRSLGVPDSVWRVAALALSIAVAFALLSGDLVLGVALLALLVVAATVGSAVEVVDAYERRPLTVVGEFREVLEPGLHLVPPFVSRTYRYDVRTQTIDVPTQEAITLDNSPVTADAVVYLRVMDAERAFLEVEDYQRAVGNLAQTTLRAALGDMELDDTLSERERINARIREELDEPTDEWGIRVETVEVRAVTPSRDVRSAMEQQTAAERRRRAMILEAQGERRSAVEQAEGNREAAVIRAQGEKRSEILESQGDAISTVLRARSAESMGERAIVEQGMDTLETIGTSESSTFVLPQEVTSLLGRYGRSLSGGAVSDAEGLESLEFDEATREMLGLDDIGEALDGATATGGEAAGAIETADVEAGEIESTEPENGR